MRLVFAGNPAIAVPSLEAASESACVLAAALTNPDSARGRGGREEPGDVAKAAAGLGIPVLKFDALRAEAREAVAALRPDLLVSFAYGRIFGPRFLALFPLGGINIHPSLLPKYRGPSPLQEAIFRRDTLSGVTIQRLAPGMDEGDLLCRQEIPLNGRETTAVLSEKAAAAGAGLLAGLLARLDREGAAALEGRPQQGEASYCTLLDRARGIIDWNKSAAEIDAQIRACFPWPLARTAHKGKTIIILEASINGVFADAGKAAGNGPVPGQVLGKDREFGILIQTGDGVLAVSYLQYQTKKALPWRAFLNGAGDLIGSCLSGGT
ncbi:MAG: methionyl-tRNA formyltransferase [Treponema sp.]|jgi:methionyl-tRNA formyltransferase|nr:methionyl-tRNA formyltransferase [Treponema sp.]